MFESRLKTSKKLDPFGKKTALLSLSFHSCPTMGQRFRQLSNLADRINQGVIILIDEITYHAIRQGPLKIAVLLDQLSETEVVVVKCVH